MKNSNIEAIVFDLAGTLIDFGSLAPSQVLIEIFNRFGIKITRKQAIGPMGIEKRAHIKALLTTRIINLQWKKKFKSKNKLDKAMGLNNISAQEAVNNALKYAEATEIRIKLNTDAEFINLTIIDNGIGFDPVEMIKSNRYKTTGNGLTSMRERAELVGGKLTIDSILNEGTTVDVEVPLEKDNYE